MHLLPSISLLASLVLLSLRHCYAQEDFMRMMMLTNLLSGGNSGGGAGAGASAFDPDPRSGFLSSLMGGNSALFGGLMGLLSRGSSGSAPLLLDIDGDILRQSQILQRGMMGGQAGPIDGSAAANGANAGAVPASVTSMLGRDGSGGSPMGPLSHLPAGIGGSSSSGSSGRSKSMPHVAMPFDSEFNGGAQSQPAAMQNGRNQFPTGNERQGANTGSSDGNAGGSSP